MLNGAEQVKRTAQLGMLAVEPENFREMKCAFWEGRALSHVICLSLFLSPRHADHVTAYCIVSTRAKINWTIIPLFFTALWTSCRLWSLQS